jgi:archaemetzincin
VGLVEMGHLGEVAVRVVAANIQVTFGAPVDHLQPLEVMEEAFVRHRQQYDAPLIIKSLAQRDYSGYLRVLALTTVDLCTPILTYVYGEAEMGGKAALVSSYRLRHNEDGTMVSLDLYYERLAKVALHELAHTFSVYHCEDPECLMHFSAKAHHLDRVRIAFCTRCDFMLRTMLKESLVAHG